MKLAEALIIRADQQKQLDQLRSRLSNNILVQEGESASEDPKDLIQQFLHLQDELCSLIQAIYRTNQVAKLENGLTIADAITLRDSILAKRNFLANAANQASLKEDRYSTSEIKKVSLLDVKELQKQVDQLSKEYRELDILIQAANWQVELRI